MSATSLINRNVQALAGRTSMRLEPELWDALSEICRHENIAMAELVQRVERRFHPGGRTSAVRVYVVEYFRARCVRDRTEIPADIEVPAAAD